jgi:D-alanyl-lipoteichoic acid acyltransferase DltB (MBOAT superfamily)
MQFDTALYVWFLFIVFAGNWALSNRPKIRYVWLLAASWTFYASWNYQLIVLIIFSTVLDYTVGWQIHRAEKKSKKLAWLVASLVGNLGVLALFKYADFFLRSIEAASHAFGSGADVPLLHLVLPVGISFYTFQTLSYTIDIYRDRLEPVDNPVKFALFVSFFPQLVAGPIVRATEFLPQLEEDPEFVSEEQSRALYLLAIGFVKKVVVADYIAVNFVDRVFQQPSMYSSLEVLSGVYGYALQIYCDFSGYTDIAIGSALLLGFQLPENFNRPYLARNLRNFWRRWHISLSTWLRDYLYISLGGSRNEYPGEGTGQGWRMFRSWRVYVGLAIWMGLGWAILGPSGYLVGWGVAAVLVSLLMAVGDWKTYNNLFITMLLGGLWHGASWNFVIWGAIHGMALALTRLYQTWREEHYPDDEPGTVREVLSIVGTFHFVCFAWIFFRAQDFGTAMTVLEQLSKLTAYHPNLTPLVAFIIIYALTLHFLPQEIEETIAEEFVEMPAAAQAAVLFGVALLLQRVKSAEVVPFIYFQF